jgi:hypothetical protein
MIYRSNKKPFIAGMKGITDHAALKASLPAKDRWGGFTAVKSKRHPSGADAGHAGTIPFPGFIPKI